MKAWRVIGYLARSVGILIAITFVVIVMTLLIRPWAQATKRFEVPGKVRIVVRDVAGFLDYSDLPVPIYEAEVQNQITGAKYWRSLGMQFNPSYDLELLQNAGGNVVGLRNRQGIQLLVEPETDRHWSAADGETALKFELANRLYGFAK